MNTAPLEDREWLRQRYEDEKLGYYRIAKLLGSDKPKTHFMRVKAALRRHAIPLRTGEAKKLVLTAYFDSRRSSRYPQLNDRAWLEQRYIAEKLTTRQIAAHIGCHQDVVADALRRNGVPLRAKTCNLPKGLPSRFRDGRATVRRIYRPINLDRRKSKYPLLNDAAWLRQKYEVEGWNLTRIGIEAMGMNPSDPKSRGANTLAKKAMRRHGIEIRRPQSSAGDRAEQPSLARI
jgi:hypothetical protein